MIPLYTFDHALFLALNFDGGPVMDRLMILVSGTAMWLPLYALILWLVWRRSGWRGMSVFLVLMLLALGLSDIVSGIFKHNGLLGDLLPQLEPRPRPMFTPTLEGLEITPDSLRALRSAAVPHDWAVHVPPEAVSGMYGTVSAHAATIVVPETVSITRSNRGPPSKLRAMNRPWSKVYMGRWICRKWLWVVFAALREALPQQGLGVGPDLQTRPSAAGRTYRDARRPSYAF